MLKLRTTNEVTWEYISDGSFCDFCGKNNIFVFTGNKPSIFTYKKIDIEQKPIFNYHENMIIHHSFFGSKSYYKIDTKEREIKNIVISEKYEQNKTFGSICLDCVKDLFIIIKNKELDKIK